MSSIEIRDAETHRTGIGRLLVLALLPLLAACTAPPVRTVGSGPVVPPPPIYRALVAEIAAQRDDYPTALALYRELMEASDDPRLAERATHLAIFARDDAAALEASRLWRERDPGNHQVGRILGSLELHAGRTEQGTAQLVQFVRDAPDPAAALGQLVVMLSRLNDPAMALEVAGRIVAAFDDVAEAHHMLGTLQRQQGDMEAASGSLARAVALRPEWGRARIERAQVLSALGRAADAEALLADGLEVDASGRDVRLAYARHLLGEGRMREALGQFERLVDDNPEDLDLRYSLALLALETGDLDVSEHYLTGLEERGTRRDEARYLLGRIAMQRDDLEAALDWFDRVEGGDYFDEARMQRIVVTARQGRLDDALAALGLLREASPELVERLWALEAELQSDAGHLEAAMAVFDAALEALPDSEELRYSRAMLAERVDDIDLLESDLRLLIERDPENASALNALGYTLADRSLRLDEALELIRRAMKLRPDDAAVIDSMGWVHYRLGNLELALNYLRDAAARDDDPEIMAHLAEVLWHTGEREQARRLVERTLLEHPDDETLRRVADWLMQ